MTSKFVIAVTTVLAGTAGALAADLPATKSAPAPASPPPFFFVNENAITIAYIPTATDPNTTKTAKKMIGFSHFDVWAYGTNLFVINLFNSDNKDPASPCGALPPPGVGGTGCAGTTEIYGFLRSTLGFNELLHTKAFSFGPLTDISLELGADANTVNNFNAAAKRDVVLGLDFTFELPYKGHLDIAPLYYKEWNHSAFVTPSVTAFLGAGPGVASGETNFDGTWAVETNYSMPLGFLPDAIPLTFSGRAAFYGPKGTGVPSGAVTLAQNPKTVTEFNSEQRLTLDVGKMVAGSAYAGFYNVFVGYRYWQDKFGLDHTKSGCIAAGAARGSCTEQSLITGATIKF